MGAYAAKRMINNSMFVDISSLLGWTCFKFIFVYNRTPNIPFSLINQNVFIMNFEFRSCVSTSILDTNQAAWSKLPSQQIK